MTDSLADRAMPWVVLTAFILVLVLFIFSVV